MREPSGEMREEQPLDPLGHIVPPGRLAARQILDGLLDAMDEARYRAGHGVPSSPTRFVVTMSPADRAWLAPGLEDELARAVERAAETGRGLLIGPVEVEFETDRATAQGRPLFWAGFAESDLLVLAAPSAALEAFARA